MSTINGYLATAGNVTLTAGEVLRALKQRRQLRPLVSRLMVDKALAGAARAAGLGVADKELQQAVNDFRRRRGLLDPPATHAWLAAEGLTVDDLEQVLESRLLVARFRDHLARTRGPELLEAHPEWYARARIVSVRVASADAARELLQQVREDGRDFIEVAREHTGQVSPPVVVLRSRLAAGIAVAVFAAKEGEVVGPLPGPHGFELIKVQAVLPTEMDETTQIAIKVDALSVWVAEHLPSLRLDASALEGLA